MSDFKELSDLSPAPRRTPTPVLWAMGAVVVAGSAALIWPVPADRQVTSSRARHARITHMGTVSAVALPAASNPSAVRAR